MKGFTSIVGRNMKVIYRSKLSFLLVILAPILIVFLVGTAFNTSQLQNIKVGTYSPEYSSLANNISANLENENFIMQKVESEEQCQGYVKTGEIHACIYFPKNLQIGNTEKQIEIYVDNSRINLAQTLVNKINNQISIKSSEIGMGIATELLSLLKEIKSSLPEQKNYIETVQTNVNNIESQSFSTAAIDSVITKLENAKDDLGDIEDTGSIMSDITSTITQLNSYKTSITSNVDSLNTNTKDSKEKLNSINSDLENLITKLQTNSIADAETIVMPIQANVNPITSDETNWVYLFPTLIALISLLSGVVLSSSIILTERRARANFRNFMTPTKGFTFIFAAYVTSMIILAIQMIILLGGSIYLTKLNLLAAIGPLTLVLFLSCSVFVLLGMLIGYVFKSDETTTLASISVASILIFFSNAIIPSESMKGVFKLISEYNPLVISTNLIKMVVLFNEPLKTLYHGSLILGIMIVVLFVIVNLARKITRRML